MLMLAAALPAALAADGDVQVDVLAGTDFPLSAGAKIHAELPHRIQARFSAGIYPEPYLNLLNAVAEGADWWDENTSALISAALKNSLVTQVSAGWRPWENRKVTFGLGYQLITLGGGLTDYETVEAVTGVSADVEAGRAIEATVNARLHQLTAEVGWRWLLRERLALQATVGGLTTLTSQTDLQITTDNTTGPGSNLAEAGLDLLEQEGEAYLDGYFQTYVHLPTVGVHLGYRF